MQVFAGKETLATCESRIKKINQPRPDARWFINEADIIGSRSIVYQGGIHIKTLTFGRKVYDDQRMLVSTFLPLQASCSKLH